MTKAYRCTKCGALRRGHVCGKRVELTPAQKKAQQHPLYPHLDGIIKRTWRSLMTETYVAGDSFHVHRRTMTPEKSGTIVGTLFEIYFQRELYNLGLGLGFYMPRTREWTKAGNHLDVMHVSVPEWNIEIKTTRDRAISQRPSSVESMTGGYWLLSVKYSWENGKDEISARFGWVDREDWSKSAGRKIRLSDDVFWDNHVSVF